MPHDIIIIILDLNAMIGDATEGELKELREKVQEAQARWEASVMLGSEDTALHEWLHGMQAQIAAMREALQGAVKAMP